MIRIDSMWLAAGPVDMRMGAERLLAQVRLPGHPNHLIDELLPHRWTASAA
jgi:hypothetical protein